MLNDDWARFVADARRATLATLDPDGRPSVVPICFVLLDGSLWSPLDEKPKRVADPRRLARVLNLLADPRAALLVDRWDEDWSRLAIVQLEAWGSLVEPGAPGHARVLNALRGKYPQYAAQRLEERPILRLEQMALGVRWGDR